MHNARTAAGWTRCRNPAALREARRFRRAPHYWTANNVMWPCRLHGAENTAISGCSASGWISDKMASSASNDNLNSGVWLKFNENLFFGEAHFLKRGIGVAGEAVTGGGEHHGGQTLLVQVEDFVIFVRLKMRSCGLRE